MKRLPGLWKEIDIIDSERVNRVTFDGTGSFTIESDGEIGIKSGRSMKLEAVEEVAISCGASRLQMDSAGNIETRGVQLLSRSSGANKIKGAAVLIN